LKVPTYSIRNTAQGSVNSNYGTTENWKKQRSHYTVNTPQRSIFKFCMFHLWFSLWHKRKGNSFENFCVEILCWSFGVAKIFNSSESSRHSRNWR